MSFADTIDHAGRALDAVGVGVIVLGIVWVTVRRLPLRGRVATDLDAFRSYRQGLGRVILLGLEILVAADIVRTVAVSPTFSSVGVLALVVGIRTVLSVSLELELEGRWPWQPAATRGD